MIFEPSTPIVSSPGEKEPEDILADIEKTAPAPAAAPPPETLPTEASLEAKTPLIASPKLIWTAGIILLILILGGIGYGLSRFLKQTAPEAPLPPPIIEEEFEETVMPEMPEQEKEFIEEEAPAMIDSDGDGLSDEEERQLGTDSFSPDTDRDGLFDYEEVYTWKTDPLKPDTDGDGFSDGEEVRGGYDPNDPTYSKRLFELP